MISDRIISRLETPHKLLPFVTRYNITAQQTVFQALDTQIQRLLIPSFKDHEYSTIVTGQYLLKFIDAYKSASREANIQNRVRLPDNGTGFMLSIIFLFSIYLSLSLSISLSSSLFLPLSLSLSFSLSLFLSLLRSLLSIPQSMIMTLIPLLSFFPLSCKCSVETATN